MSQTLAIFIAAVSVLANGFFVAAEFAIVKVRGTRIEELAEGGSRRAKLAAHIIEHLDAYLSACQLGITIASLALGWVGEPALAHLLGPLLQWVGVTSEAVVSTVSVAVAFTAISFLHIVVGEMAPKTMAVRDPDAWALRVAYPLRAFFWVMYPFIWVLNASSNGLLRLLRIDPASPSELAHSEEELRMIVASSHESGVLDKYEREMLDNVFDFGEHTVHEVMVPRPRMAVLSADHPFEENLAIVRTTMHTRYPLVRGDDKDTVLGMIHLKDLYTFLLDSGGEPPDLEKVQREILAVPDTLSISNLLALFRKRRIHMAIGIDEFGGISGLVTLEDLIEELVGEIEDEFDSESDPIKSEGTGVWSVDGNLSLKDLAKLTGQRIEEEEVDSVGGLLMVKLNRIARQGDKVRLGALELEIVQMQDFQIGRVSVRVVSKGDEPVGDGDA